MKFCSSCGKEINTDAVVCVHCGCAVKNSAVSDSNDTGSAGYTVLGFFVPWIVTLVLYITWKDTAPLNAKALLKGLIIQFIAGAVATVLYLIFFFVVFGAALVA